MNREPPGPATPAAATGPATPTTTGAGVDPVLAPLLQIIGTTRPGADARLIERAYQAAAHWHQGQRRRSGDPYVTHPLAVATILAGFGADDQTLCAALLHDTIEDTPYTLAALRAEFGPEIAALVGGFAMLDKAARWPTHNRAAARMMADAMSGDVRIPMIKLADRLHNMRTLRHLPRAKQERKSRQTLEIFAPLALQLGMGTIKSELEDLASATLCPPRHRKTPAISSGVLAAITVLLPPASRARWREEWLAELQVLPTRRKRATFAAQTLRGIPRLAVTLRRPTAGNRT